MKINQQFQDLHTQGGPVDWVLKQRVERDICLLYHQLANYSYIMGDLYYGSVFNLPYWEHLDFPGLDRADRDFLRDGCLVMILAMAWEQIDSSGAYLKPHIPTCREALNRIAGKDDDTRKLIATVKLALETAERGGPEIPELQELSAWVHKRYVREYFRRVSREFESNPYFRTGEPGA
jgi:hypothetical protein